MALSFPFVRDKIARQAAPSADAAESLVRGVFRNHPDPAFSIRLWDGRDVSFGRPPAFTLGFEDADTFTGCLRSCDPAEFAEAYIEGRVTITGDVAEAVKLAAFLRTVKLDLRTKLSAVSTFGLRPSKHSVRSDTRDVQAHYDLSDDFFKLFLDERMVYSCAYFAHPDDTLEQAQAHKLDLICRKLRLAPGESLLDIGCGWGALVVWAARHYGVNAHGITLSDHQAAEARRRVKDAGLAERVTIEKRHYADVRHEPYDKVASVGMYEHVGLEKLPMYFRSVYQVLRPGGLFLNHGITAPTRRIERLGGAFLRRHVFPGGELAGLPHLQTVMEVEGFEIVDVESLRRHYALTLNEWYKRFRAARGRAATLVSDQVLRTWDLYLTGCAQAFADGSANVHQVLAAKPGPAGDIQVPLTRRDLLV